MRIWIVNNYAIPPRFGGLVRHYYFSKYLRSRGHEVRIITGSQVHNTDQNFADPGKLLKEVEFDGVPYTYVRTTAYRKNDWRRIKNMLEFTTRCKKAMKQLYEAGEHPDVIYASSPLPMSSKSALDFAKKHHIPFVFEVRDLWPESLVQYGSGKLPFVLHPIISALYHLEHHLYRKANAILFTMAGGKDYIRDKGWTDIDLSHVYQLNNGVDLEEFDRNLQSVHYEDSDLEDPETYQVVYMGSIRSAYYLDLILDAAKIAQKEIPDVRFLFYGAGPERERLEKRCQEEQIENTKFKGRVSKERIPGILHRADLTLLHLQRVPLLKYGVSSNKMFEYLAAGTPILSTVNPLHSVVREQNCGIELESQTPRAIVDGIREAHQWSPEERKQRSENARRIAQSYDYEVLSRRLESILGSVITQEPASKK